jgi:hypothetical protein
MSDTAPPRRDPSAQHDPGMHRGHTPAPGRRLQRFVVLGERPRQRAVEDVACRHAQLTELRAIIDKLAK